MVAHILQKYIRYYFITFNQKLLHIVHIDIISLRVFAYEPDFALLMSVLRENLVEPAQTTMQENRFNDEEYDNYKVKIFGIEELILCNLYH